MTTLPQVANAMQTVLTTLADQAAQQTGFLQRQRQLTGATFVQTLVFGWLANPDASLEELAQTAAAWGVPISSQGLDQRFPPAAARCLEPVLEVALTQLIAADPVAMPLLQRFNGVYLPDSSVLSLPQEREEVWPGCGGHHGSTAALQLQVRWELSRGQLDELELQAGREHDRSSTSQRAPLPQGALRLADLGYFDLERLAQLDRQGVYWLSRGQAGTVVYDQAGQRRELLELLESAEQPQVDRPIQLGPKQRLPGRLLAVRVSEEVANRRRQPLHKEARRRGPAVSRERLRLADGTSFVTNVPAAQLSLEEALVLARVRWQMELLFKWWKSPGQGGRSRSQKPWRIWCEIYAKLVAMLVPHWILLTSGWEYADRSLGQAARTIQKLAFQLASVLDRAAQLCEVLGVIQRCLAVGCRINKRKKAPATYQLLLR